MNSEDIDLEEKQKAPCVAAYKNPTAIPHAASVFETSQANATVS